MTPIHHGSRPNPIRIFKGQQELYKIYKGSNLVWQKTEKEVDPSCDPFYAAPGFYHLYKTDSLPPIDLMGNGTSQSAVVHDGQVFVTGPPHGSCMGGIEIKQASHDMEDTNVPLASLELDINFTGNTWERTLALWLRVGDVTDVENAMGGIALLGPIEGFGLVLSYSRATGRLSAGGGYNAGNLILTRGSGPIYDNVGLDNWVRVCVAYKAFMDGTTRKMTFRRSINGIIPAQDSTFDLLEGDKEYTSGHRFAGGFSRYSDVYNDGRFNGAVSDIKVYDRFLTIDEMACDYHAGTCYGYDLDFDFDADI